MSDKEKCVIADCNEPAKWSARCELHYWRMVAGGEEHARFCSGCGFRPEREDGTIWHVQNCPREGT